MSDPIEDFLYPCIITLLTPLFLPITQDLEQARQAAIATIQSVQGKYDTDLINIAQIIAFGLCAINTLGRTMDENLDVKLLIRLNNSATALARCEDRNRRFLTNRPTRKPAPEPTTPEEDAAIKAETQKQISIAKDLQATVQKIERIQKNPEEAARRGETIDKRFTTDPKDLHWAFNYALVAEDCAKDPAGYTNGCQKEANIRAKLLNGCAYDVLCGIPADLSSLGDFKLDQIKHPSPTK